MDKGPHRGYLNLVLTAYGYSAHGLYLSFILSFDLQSNLTQLYLT